MSLAQHSDERSYPPIRRANWGLLAAAFSDDTAGVRWYLHAVTGEVVRVVENERPPGFLLDAGFVSIERARSKEQYRWMQRYIVGLADRELAAELSRAIAGKRAFQRFKAALAAHPGRIEEWFTFRGAELARYMRAWLEAHELALPPETPYTAFLIDGEDRDEPAVSPPDQLGALIDELDVRDLESLLALAQLLQLNTLAAAGANTSRR